MCIRDRYQIASKLKSEKVLIPSAYLAQHGELSLIHIYAGLALDSSNLDSAVQATLMESINDSLRDVENLSLIHI